MAFLATSASRGGAGGQESLLAKTNSNARFAVAFGVNYLEQIIIPSCVGAQPFWEVSFFSHNTKKRKSSFPFFVIHPLKMRNTSLLCVSKEEHASVDIQTFGRPRQLQVVP